MAPPKALLFDLDGVLVESEPLHLRTWLECLGEAGVRLEPGEHPYLRGRTGEQVLEWLLRRPQSAGLDLQLEPIVRSKRDLFAALIETELRPVAGVDVFLRRWKGTLPLGLVTSAKLKTVGRVMLAQNWRNIFDALIGADHVQNTKPHPEPYLHAAQRLKLPPGDCLVFEDSEVGIEAARGAGMGVCGVATTLAAGELIAAGAHWTIADFTDEAGLRPALEGRRPGVVSRWFRGLGK